MDSVDKDIEMLKVILYILWVPLAWLIVCGCVFYVWVKTLLAGEKIHEASKEIERDN